MYLIQFFYDIVSPYSWFGFEQVLDADAAKHFKVVLRPFFLGGVMKASGNTPPGSLPAKGRYMAADMQRVARYLGMKMGPVPSVFPVNSLKAQRILALLQKQHPDLLVPVSRAFWTCLWGAAPLGNKDISNESVLLSALAGVLQSSMSADAAQAKAQELMTASNSDAVKQTLTQNTETAIKHGAFGAPALVVHQGQRKPFLIFGSDRFPILYHELGVKNPPLGPKQYHSNTSTATASKL
jgi:glutathione S-transferase kappa 1